jgi:uncharacterized membrane protein YeaQ/YmgE (transglycosylase-associated protein family)
MKRISLLFLALALLYTGAGFLPGRTLAPLDLPLDTGAWKHDPTERVRVSNSLLSDVIVQFIPWDREIARLFAEGELPWVNRFAGEGAPLFANPQTAIFSPFTWPRFLFGLDGWAIAALLKIVAAAFCAYWLARELDVAREQAVVSSIVYATSGFMVVWLLWPHTNVFALLPGLAAAAMRLMKSPTIHNATLVILFAALCTAGGHPETLFVGVIGIWIFLFWEAEKRPELGVGAIVPSSVGALLGFGLLAAQVLPFVLLVSDSYSSTLRPNLPHEFREWSIVSQVLPGILGSPLRGELDLTAVVSADSFHFRTAAFVGALVLLAIIATWRDLTLSLRRGLVIGVIGLVLSWDPPGVWQALRHVPLFRLAALEYMAILFVLFASIAAGPALFLLASRRRRRLGAALVIAGALLLTAGIVPALPAMRPMLTRAARQGIDQLRARGHMQQAPEVYEQRLAYYLGAAGATTLRRVALPGAMVLLGGIALLGSWRRRDLVFSAAAIGELLVFGIGYTPAVRMTNVPPEPEVIAAMRKLDPDRRSLFAAHFSVFPANLGTLYGVRDAISYDVLDTKSRVTQLTRAGFDPVMHTFNPILSPEQVQDLRRLGVRFVLSRDDVAGARRVAGPPHPAVGLYEIEGGAVPVPLPSNRAPTGAFVGFALSLIAAACSAVWLRLYTLEPSAEPAHV